MLASLPALPSYPVVIAAVSFYYLKDYIGSVPQKLPWALWLQLIKAQYVRHTIPMSNMPKHQLGFNLHKPHQCHILYVDNNPS